MIKKCLSPQLKNSFLKMSMRMSDAKTQTEYAQFQRTNVVNKLPWLMGLLLAESLMFSALYLSMRTDRLEQSELYKRGSLLFLVLLSWSMLWVCLLTYLLQLKWPWMIETLSATLLTALVVNQVLCYKLVDESQEQEQEQDKDSDRQSHLLQMMFVNTWFVYLIAHACCISDYLPCMVARVLGVVVSCVYLAAPYFSSSEAWYGVLVTTSMLILTEIPSFFSHKTQADLFLIKRQCYL